MKKIVSFLFAGTLFFGSANAQILSEQNVTINMDLQPVLQLELEGPQVIDFNFTEIRDYRDGITRYGANILKASASVSFDLWASGFSQGLNSCTTPAMCWDVLAAYGNGGANSTTNLPMSVLEIHQLPANPSVAASVANGTFCGSSGAIVASSDMDYSEDFQNIDGAGIGNNGAFFNVNGNPYFAPDDVAAGEHDKYIAGGKGLANGCQQAGGTWLQGTVNTDGANTAENQAFTGNGYYFVLDYRLAPGLPAIFPMASSVGARVGNATSPTQAAVTAAANDFDFLDQVNHPGSYVQGGSYQMNIKYIMVEDQ